MNPLVGAMLPGLAEGVLGMFSARRERRNALKDARMQFTRLRSAAEAGGFNPLTALQYTGTAGFNNLPSGAPPLASIQAIGGSLRGMSDELTGAAAQRRASDKLRDDLTAIQIDQAKAEIAATAAATKAYASRSATISAPGRSPVTVSNPSLGPGRIGPALDRPNRIDGGDGLDRATPDDPAEFEMDVWQWTREGLLPRRSATIIADNLGLPSRQTVRQRINEAYENQPPIVTPRLAFPSLTRPTQDNPPSIYENW